MNPASYKMPTPLPTSQILRDKFDLRKSTPDSEALASSDDDGERVEAHHQHPILQNPIRRASWFKDESQGPQPGRKSSFASSMSPTNSHPGTPAGESGPWGSHASAGRGTNSFPWSNASGIWNNDARKEAPKRLTAVLPSPTSGRPPSDSFYGSDAGRDHVTAGNIPFAIPLHPTPKTYRSQSYSVGQQDSNMALPGPPGLSNTGGRGRQHGLSHRPSRPSMLSGDSERALGRLKEVDDDDDESANGSLQGSKAQHSEAEAIRILTRENALLRQQQTRLRPRASTSAMYASGMFGAHNALPEESEYAIDEMDELQSIQDSASSVGRRMSEFGTNQARIPSLTMLENRNLENVRKSQWQSHLGFGGLGGPSQSRRHSFAAAELPARHDSVGSIGEPISAREASFREAGPTRDYHQATFNDLPNQVTNEHRELGYGVAGNRAPLIQGIPAAYFRGAPGGHGADHSAYQVPAQPTPQGMYAGGRASPHRSMFGMTQPRQNQPLYVVLFKCSRADVFYVQEGTGLSVKPGDLVIVEADRGTDLGTVAKANVDWTTAKELKEHYAEEHYKWLMMYSQGASGTADGTGAGLMAAANVLQGSAVGGMGPPGQHGNQESGSGDLKPKIIKRLAQTHEVQALRDKEGNEAKAKRVCMQKVKEHGLQMEILDAEFQMDWKKLTFYYFADAYINFNSLVTDLFKVYKTRIWMSAINPASFASPSLGLQAPSGVGPGAVGASRSTQSSQRQAKSEQHAPSYDEPGTARRYPAGAAPPFTPALDRNSGAAPAFQPSGFAYYPPFDAVSRNMAAQAGFMPPPMMDAYGPYPGMSGYHDLAPRFTSPSGMGVPSHGAAFGAPGAAALTSPSDAWVSSFQGLSLNTRQMG